MAIRRRAASRTDDPRWYLDHSAFSVDVRVLNASAFVRLAARVLAHARRHLSSSGMAAHVLAIMGLDADAHSSGGYEPPWCLLSAVVLPVA